MPNRDERAFVEMQNQIVIAATRVHRIPPFKMDFGGILLACSVPVRHYTDLKLQLNRYLCMIGIPSLHAKHSYIQFAPVGQTNEREWRRQQPVMLLQARQPQPYLLKLSDDPLKDLQPVFGSKGFGRICPSAVVQSDFKYSAKSTCSCSERLKPKWLL
jgi:hypothetical protein